VHPPQGVQEVWDAEAAEASEEHAAEGEGAWDGAGADAPEAPPLVEPLVGAEAPGDVEAAGASV
jgi:hypothetical protein